MRFLDVGRRLRLLRQHRKLSLYDVERMTGYHYSTVGKYERGLRKPSVEVLRELARVYEVPLSDIIGEAGPEVDPERRMREAAWLDLLRVRPELGELVDAAAELDPERIRHLVAFLRPGR
ncbi:MAG: helix-turn-helix transcriptional regulator [Clostridia bacterium]|nr:helix-turn-helix transcriptional regulator [Clostridia bacterium]